jgi:hypothetical protein
VALNGWLGEEAHPDDIEDVNKLHYKVFEAIAKESTNVFTDVEADYDFYECGDE